MRKNVLGLIALFVVAIVAAWNVSLNSQNNQLSGISLANVEALAEENNDHKYENKRINEITIHDDATGTYKKIAVIECEGSGNLDC
ncbi:MAG: NVEALA domain-containing protein [Prevotellaceae bacterium]|jgi:hypothetical protein|nr:NVEALA domain-containing protein [Prevotellaceae bacterium]